MNRFFFFFYETASDILQIFSISIIHNGNAVGATLTCEEIWLQSVAKNDIETQTALPVQLKLGVKLSS